MRTSRKPVFCINIAFMIEEMPKACYYDDYKKTKADGK